MILILKHEGSEGAGTLKEFLSNTRYGTREVALYNNEALPSLDDCDAIVSMGGPMNVYEESRYSFLELENEFLKKAIEKRRPVLGICLGAQLLAKCARGRVAKAAAKEVGWSKVRLTKAAHTDPLFKGMPETMDVFQWHEDTFAIPSNGALLATGDAVKHQAMRVGESAWALQFHPEMTAQIIGDWILRDRLGDAAGKEMLDSYTALRAEYHRQSEILYSNFVEIISHNQ